MLTASLSWFSYLGVRDALEGEFQGRLRSIAGTIASQISPDDLADARLFGEDGSGYGHLQVMLEELRATSGIVHASVVDTSRLTIYDTAGPDLQRQTTRLDSVLAGAIDRVWRGETVVTRRYRVVGELRQVSAAPVLAADRHATGLVAVEARVDYLDELDNFRRSLALITFVIALAIGVLAIVVIRTAWSAARLEQRLSRSENLAAMGRLTATLAHEIKNPLAIIRGSVQRLGKLEPEAQRMAEYVVEEVDRLTHTVARYLRFARADEVGGRGDASATLRATLDLVEGELAARHVTLAMPELAVAWPVRLDNESLKQVYLNLILNAVEAMPEGGRLSIEPVERAGRIEVNIRDEGTGILPEVMKQLGEPFYSTKAKGSGIGLFLTRRLLESAGGSLRIHSEPGRGTTCTVSLPIARD